ncbi:amine oxidase catalytic domain-containing protein [Patellaria atrata CBS 101060]|uniref:Amine oxidase n=1 Tax=Patellaria atrata CBS 101060 TaxID=1346257 RepID=A0A9P4S5G6_9PEZI|nr:amine oxidase catalytic domain-containing protein [Patellaria atrata CBS 101060]
MASKGPQRSWIVLSSIVVFFFIIVVSLNSHSLKLFSRLGSDRPQAQRNNEYRAPRSNVWADLNPEEVTDLLDYLYTYEGDGGLNLTRNEKATAWDNSIASLEVLTPNKTDVLKWLHNPSTTPQRWARVIVNKGAAEKATIHEYMVGPIPIGSETQILPLSYCHNSGRHYVKNPLPNYLDIINWFSDLGDEVSDIVEHLLAEVANPGNLSYSPPFFALSRTAQFNNGSVSNWATINSPGLAFDAFALLPQGVFCRFDITGRESKEWKIVEWYYNGKLYNSTDAFRQAVKNPKFERLPPNIDGSWTNPEPLERGLPARDILPPPVVVQPAGSRVQVDEKEKFVSWMGFDFYLSTSQATGVSLWDIKFRGEAIIYELGMQEAMAHYAGNDPMSSGQVWLDSLFGMGLNLYELVPGYDCPTYATYLSTSFQMGDKAVQRNNSICVFEYVADYPIQRHTATMHLSISKSTYLVVRSVSTVGNYDYTFDYIFYLDGTVEVKVRASGYIFGSYNSISPDELGKRSPGYEYGYQVHELVTSVMHDHVINFKADLDIAGTANTLVKVNVVRHDSEYPWDGYPRKTMKLNREAVETETGLNWPRNAGSMYVVLNNDSRNIWGEKRGYRIAPGTGMGNPPHLTMEDGSTALKKAATWSMKDLWILKHHDDELKSTSEYNNMEPEDPLIDFEKMVDGESIQQEDLVVYFNLGTHHIPHSGDIPNTLEHTSSSSVMFIPHNFHDRDPSRESSHGVKLEKDESGRSTVKYFGAKYEDGFTVDVRDIEPDLRNRSKNQGFFANGEGRVGLEPGAAILPFGA